MILNAHWLSRFSSFCSSSEIWIRLLAPVGLDVGWSETAFIPGFIPTDTQIVIGGIMSKTTALSNLVQPSHFTYTLQAMCTEVSQIIGCKFWNIFPLFLQIFTGARYGDIHRSRASPRPACDGTPWASVWPSARQTPGTFNEVLLRSEMLFNNSVLTNSMWGTVFRVRKSSFDSL